MVCAARYFNRRPTVLAVFKRERSRRCTRGCIGLNVSSSRITSALQGAAHLSSIFSDGSSKPRFASYAKNSTAYPKEKTEDRERTEAPEQPRVAGEPGGDGWNHRRRRVRLSDEVHCLPHSRMAQSRNLHAGVS